MMNNQQVLKIAEKLVSSEMLTPEEARTMLDKAGFDEADFDEFENDMKEYDTRGFDFRQVAPFEKNVKSMIRELRNKNKKFYIVKLSKGFHIRAWSYR